MMKNVLLGLVKTMLVPIVLLLITKFWWGWPSALVYLLILNAYLMSFYLFEVPKQQLKKKLAFIRSALWCQLIFLAFFLTIGLPNRHGQTSESFWQMAHPVKFLIIGWAVASVISLLLWKKKEEGQS
ncbi:hypothetical protein [Streptococcus sp. A22]|uniref:hypothetical protein n=1 Tax=Streptococcus sp. A22 TaxID=3373126 RepID=UPI00374D9074